MVLQDLRLVPEEVHLWQEKKTLLTEQMLLATYQDVNDLLEELEVVQMDHVFVNAVSEEVLSDARGRPEQAVVQYFQELSRVTLLGPAVVKRCKMRY